jgi:hypothetical protein
VPNHNLSSNGLCPNEGLTKSAEILVAGLMRLRARQSSSLSADRGESSLDLTGRLSGADEPNLSLWTHYGNRAHAHHEASEPPAAVKQGEVD